jgi:hypothetical protein
MYSVTVDHPDVGEQDVYIHGLGTFKNGTTTTVSDEQAESYRVHNATQVQTHTPDGGLQVESVLGPPIEDLDNSPWFTVKKTSKSGEGPEPAPEPASNEKGGKE